MSEGKGSPRMWIVATAIVAPVMYVASFGPICLAAAWAESWGLMPNWMESVLDVFFWPLELAIAQWPFFSAAMQWYINLLRPLGP